MSIDETMHSISAYIDYFTYVNVLEKQFNRQNKLENNRPFTRKVDNSLA